MTHARSTQSTRCLIVLAGKPASTDQQLEEAVSVALVLASFEHHVQLALTQDTLYLCHTRTHKAHKMLKSLALYDMPPLWLLLEDHAVEDDAGMIPSDIPLKIHSHSILDNPQTAFDTVWIL